MPGIVLHLPGKCSVPNVPIHAGRMAGVSCTDRPARLCVLGMGPVAPDDPGINSPHDPGGSPVIHVLSILDGMRWLAGVFGNSWS
jgi:hypothetical protein